MNRLNKFTAALLLTLPLITAGCASYSAYQKAHAAERVKDWDIAVAEYEKALEIDPDNTRFRIDLQRARLEASRVHFEKGKSLLAAASKAATGSNEQLRAAQMAATELEITVKLDSTNQYAVIEMTKALAILDDFRKAAAAQTTVDDIKKRAKANITKTQPPQLNPASDQPISLSFPRETNVKDIYRALANAFGINILFDQAVKDDRITIELKDVTAQQALERVMQAANHFYKVLDEHTIIVVPDNPQARRDYEDLVIQTFYLSNGDAEQVTNVVRTMIEARNVFPLKALNAITIRDTADKVKIAEKIIEANDKAKAEVVVAVELVQLDLTKLRDIGLALAGMSADKPGVIQPTITGSDGKIAAFGSGTLGDIARTLGSLNDIKNNTTFTVPSATYAMIKTVGDSELLASPQLRISEGEKATLHIGKRIPVPVSTFTSVSTTTSGTFAPVTSYQYQDVGIKVSMEPRVHHNREVTLKLTVEVSDQAASIGDPPQPVFATRTIESTIRLKDGETNFLAGLIQHNEENQQVKTPLLGDLPFVGRLFTRDHKNESRTDLVLTMTPHIVRIADITEDDVAPMWVGTSNNITFRGVSPRVESQAGIDPFSNGRSAETTPPPSMANLPLADGEPGNYIIPPGGVNTAPAPNTPPPGSAPSNPFQPPKPPQQQPPVPESKLQPQSGNTLNTESAPDIAALRLAPRMGAQPSNVLLKPGESHLWSIVGMDLDGLNTDQLLLHYDPKAMDVSEVIFGSALAYDPAKPPAATVNRDSGTIRIVATDGKPLHFQSGGDVVTLRVQGGISGDTYLVVENPDFHDAKGQAVVAAIAGGRAKVQ